MATKSKIEAKIKRQPKSGGIGEILPADSRLQALRRLLGPEETRLLNHFWDYYLQNTSPPACPLSKKYKYFKIRFFFSFFFKVHRK